MMTMQEMKAKHEERQYIRRCAQWKVKEYLLSGEAITEQVKDEARILMEVTNNDREYCVKQLAEIMMEMNWEGGENLTAEESLAVDMGMMEDFAEMMIDQLDR